MELEIIHKKLEIKYYKSILFGINESNPNFTWLQSYCDKLIDILNSDKEKLSETQTQQRRKMSHYRLLNQKTISKFFQMKTYIKNRG